MQIGPEYEGATAGAAWEKTANAFRSPSLLQLIEGYALVTDIPWAGEMTELAGFLLPFPLRVYGHHERDDAIEWLTSLPEGPGVSHRLVPETGVLVVEVSQPLRVPDFDALSATADAWLEAHGELPGVVMHAHTFPGWENVAGLMRHIRFVRDHHRKVRRVALASDSTLTDLMPRLTGHFVRAEVKAFGYDELDEAITWAAGPTANTPTERSRSQRSVPRNG
jgi:hypothetical protein